LGIKKKITENILHFIQQLQMAVPPAGTMANDSINTDILHTQTMDYTSKTLVTPVIVREWRPLLEIFGN